MTQIRHNWTRQEALQLIQQPLNDLLFQAHSIHREFHNPNEVQVSRLLSIKTGKCPEDCAYCPQSIRFNTGLQEEELLELKKVVAEAKQAKESGATRFCMGAAWRSPKNRDMPLLTEMVKEVKGLGLETCMTLGMLSQEQAQGFADAGLDYYNHNLDTSEEHYGEIITTRTYQDRLDTIQNVQNAQIKVCSGGILGLGEQEQDRAGLLVQLANLPQHPDSVPINQLVRVEGTPLANNQDLDGIDFIRVIATSRIMMPKAAVRLSAGREEMSDEMQAMAFFAGANSIFYGEKLLTTDNPAENQDIALFEKLGITAQALKDAGTEAVESDHIVVEQGNSDSENCKIVVETPQTASA
ncbi:MAG: biotin synthase BioB [Acidiferrobacterales bacterium]|nr:biotin synthase BioB [Acidiferrobacterales bacterium]